MPYVIRNIRVELDTGEFGQFVLRWMSVGSYEFLLGLSEALEDREYCVQFIHHQLIEPSLTIETVRKLPDKALIKIARKWSKDDTGLGQTLPRNGRVFSTFKAALISYKNRQAEMISQPVRSVSSSLDNIAKSALRSYSAVSSLSNQWRSLDYIHSIAEQVQVLAQVRPPAQVFELATYMRGLNLSAAFHGLDKSLALSAFSSINGTLSEIRRTISTASLTFASTRDLFASVELGKLWTDQATANLSLIIKGINVNAAITSPDVPALLNAAFTASNAFSRYYDEFLAAIHIPSNAEPTRTSIVLPPLTTAVTLGTVYKAGFRDGDLVAQEAIDEGILAAQDENADNIEFYLSQVDSRFVDKWRGCMMTMRSNNPDKITQASHGGRELLTQLLHTLAPDELFSPEELKIQKDGRSRPTRKMRVAKYLGVKKDSNIAELVEAQANVLDALYAVLSDASHDHNDKYSSITISGFMQALGGIIVALLSSKLGSPND